MPTPLTAALPNSPAIVGENCPWCDQPIPHEKFDEIHARIETKERQRAAEHERRLRDQFAQERARLEASASTREKAARTEGAKAAETALAPVLAELGARKSEVEAELGVVKANHQTELTTRLQEQRESLGKDKTNAVNAEKANAFKDRQKLEEKLQELQRQLQNKTANELGEGAEVDLFETLKGEFEGDRLRRVGKGNPGADLIHEVVHNGAVCGKIIYDSKNRSAWRNDYVTKLRQDQLAEKGDHAVLATSVFPAGAKQLHIQDGVVIANPARVVALVMLLRKQIIHSHTLRLSGQARELKTARLYAFITSEQCKQFFERVESLSEDLLDLDVKEVSAHNATWKKRGQLVRAVQKVSGDLSSEIDRILGTAAKD